MILRTQIIILAVLITLSAFFSGSEIALFSLSKLRTKYLVKKKIKGSKAVDKLKKNPQRLLITILIGNNLMNVAASAFATSIAFQFSQNFAVGIATGIMTLLLLVFGEITPKSIAARYNQRISLLIAKPIQILQIILFPIVIIFEVFVNLMAPNKKERPLVTEEDLKTYVSIGEEIGQIKESEKNMINRIFVFNDLEAKNVMTPRKKIAAVSEDKSVKEIVSLFKKKGHSKLVVFKGTLDNIQGFIHVKDIPEALIKNQEVSSIVRPILFVPADKKLDSLLKFFQRKKNYMAIVTDEFGTNLGLITLEDVLEEIVGEIMDETEKVQPKIKKISPKSFLVDGGVDIDEINQTCKLKLPEKEAPYAISSYILHQLGRMPKLNEVIEFPGCKIKVKKLTKNIISEIVINKN